MKESQLRSERTFRSARKIRAESIGELLDWDQDDFSVA
jgi:hypothetical protein